MTRPRAPKLAAFVRYHQETENTLKVAIFRAKNYPFNLFSLPILNGRTERSHIWDLAMD